jgi:hypothetical protein
VESSRGAIDRGVEEGRSSPPRIPLDFLADHQRIVVNPFLGVLAWVGTVVLIEVGVRRRSLALFLAGVGLLIVGFVLHQFHCLDCGATGWLYHYRRHACPSVVARYENREARRFRIPNVPTQVTIWIYVLAGALFLLLLWMGGPRR